MNLSSNESKGSGYTDITIDVIVDITLLFTLNELLFTITT
jgi:hypothetical protein